MDAQRERELIGGISTVLEGLLPWGTPDLSPTGTNPTVPRWTTSRDAE